MQTIGKIELKQLKDGKKVNVHLSSLEGFEMTVFDVKNNLTPEGDFDDGEIQITSISKAHPERKIMPGVPTGIMISNSKGNLHLHIYLDPMTTQKFFEYLYLIAYGATSPPSPKATSKSSKATPKATAKKGAKASSKAKSKTKASPKKKRPRLEDLEEEDLEEEEEEEAKVHKTPSKAKATAKAKPKSSKAKAKSKNQTPKKVVVDPASKLVVYTDGSAAPTNPGPGGWAAVLYEVQGEGETEEEVEIDTSTGSYPHCGNGKMEITAAIAGLELLPLGCEDAEFFTDAKYAADTIGRGVLGVHPKTGRKTGKPSGWIQGWKDHGWVKSSGGAPENLPEIKKLYAVLDKHIKAGSYIVIKWVKAHNGTPGNERADQLANEARKIGLRNR